MSKVTIIVVPESSHHSKQFSIPGWFFHAAQIGSVFSTFLFGYLIFDYLSLREQANRHKAIVAENLELKSEAEAAVKSFKDVEDGLDRIRDYTEQLTQITNVKVKTFSSKTGIGPLSKEEFEIAERQIKTVDHIPDAVTQLYFRPIFDKMNALNVRTYSQEIELQQILSSLSQKKSLLASIPSITPVKGWITSGFGSRLSPFTGARTHHRGLDIASQSGSPIFSPADGVVIYSGIKDGFGNFVMIAHGYGIVTRYGHNAQNLVQPGQKISRGEQIATVGTSGRTTGPHVHYEVLHNGRYVDPKKFILDRVALAH
jgi:murein DD-endopeptidase MepM/ murein hydrolase activator NlpD